MDAPFFDASSAAVGALSVALPQAPLALTTLAHLSVAPNTPSVPKPPARKRSFMGRALIVAWLARGKRARVINEPMRDDSGQTITDAAIHDRVAKIGAVVVIRGPVESSDFAIWRRGLRKAARAREFRLSVRRIDELIVVSNPDHIVTDEQRAAAVARMATHPSFQLAPEPARRPHLHSVPPAR